MPPKKASKNRVSISIESGKAEKTITDSNVTKDPVLPTSDPSHEIPATGSNKRKRKQLHQSQLDPNKTPRRSTRGANSASPSTTQLLNFLLSASAMSLCRPPDEFEAVQGAPDLLTYSGGVGRLSPFEELVCAVVLSRPISHRLGARTIRTALNAPYEFNTPKAIQSAGEAKVLQSLWDARTQHKDKTAREIAGLAEVVVEKFCSNGDPKDTSMPGLREQADRDAQGERDLLKGSIKGLGKTGLDIFFRRVQWMWEEVYPFVDERTGAALKQLGLPKGKELSRLIEDKWSELEVQKVEGQEHDVEKRKVFVTVLERATGAHLEHHIDELLMQAAKS